MTQTLSAVVEFLRQVCIQKPLQLEVRSITEPNLILNIAKKYNYIFDLQELAQVIYPLKEKYDNNVTRLKKTKTIDGFMNYPPIIAEEKEVLALLYFHNDFFQNLETYK